MCYARNGIVIEYHKRRAFIRSYDVVSFTARLAYIIRY